MEVELSKIAASVTIPETYADPDKIHKAFAVLRQHSPVHWVDAEGIRPFWAVTRHADILAVEQQHRNFLAAPRTVLFNELAETALCQLTGRKPAVRPLTHMDEPDHRIYRAITQATFAPENLQRLEDSLANMARETVDQLSNTDLTYDFATLAAFYPLRVMMSILGVPTADLPLMLELNRNLLGVDDPNRRTKDDPFEAIRTALIGFRDYFDKLTEDRRTRPLDDLATVIANSTFEGKPIPDFERLSYFIILATAGHDTTSFAITGGLQALIEHPDQLKLLKKNPGLLEQAVDEILRWSSPVRHFMRTAREECKVGGIKVRSGDSLALFFISANRDEKVFFDGQTFLASRTPNPQIAFGHGIHFCLGHHLAKIEIRALFKELLGRLEHIELAGEPKWAKSNFVGGIRSLPVRCWLRPVPRQPLTKRAV
jgi:cytochrome P450